MKFVVLGAFGKTGRAVIAELESRGHEVLAVAHRRHDDISFANELIKSTVELTEEDIAGYDVIIDAISAWTPETFPIHNQTVAHLAKLITGTNMRYIKVGGTGTMFINEEHTKQLCDWSEFPDELKPLAKTLSSNLNYIRTFSDMNWTYVSPAFNYDAEGEKTGEYNILGEHVPVETLVRTVVSYADYAVALVDIAESGDYIRRRIFVRH